VKRLALHHKLRNRKVQLNDTIGENFHLKTNINIMRKEINFAKDAISSMTENIERLKYDATNSNKDAVV
jgi:hypothetical protein